MFKISLSKFIEIQKMPHNLQNKLQVNESKWNVGFLKISNY